MVRVRSGPSGQVKTVGGGGAQTLAATLALGNKTGGTPIIVSLGDYMMSEEGALNLLGTLNVVLRAITGGIYMHTSGDGEIDIHAGGTTNGPLARLQLRTATVAGVANSGEASLVTGSVAEGISGTLLVATGDAENGSSGEMQVVTGDVFAGTSGELTIMTGTGDPTSGPVSMSSGLATLTSGKVLIESGGIPEPLDPSAKSGNLEMRSGDVADGGSGDVIIATGNGEDTSGAIVIQTGTATNRGPVIINAKAVTIVVDGTAYVLPANDGTAGQVLSTDGAGNLSWITP